MTPAVAAEVAAVVATLVALVTIVPQVRVVVTTGDTAGVSVAAALLGLVNEAFWVGYFVDRRMWLAVPESVITFAATAVLVVVLVGRRAGASKAVAAAVFWCAVLAVAAGVGGHQTLGLLLVMAFAVQLAPAVWTAYRIVPTGVSSATWMLFGGESALWLLYGGYHRDVPTVAVGCVGMLAAAAMLARKLVTRTVSGAAGTPGAPGAVAVAVTKALS